MVIFDSYVKLPEGNSSGFTKNTSVVLSQAHLLHGYLQTYLQLISICAGVEFDPGDFPTYHRSAIGNGGKAIPNRFLMASNHTQPWLS